MSPAQRLRPWHVADGEPLSATDVEIGRALGVDGSTVSNWRARLGIPKKSAGGRPIDKGVIRRRVQDCLRSIERLPHEDAVNLLCDIADDVMDSLDREGTR